MKLKELTASEWIACEEQAKQLTRQVSKGEVSPMTTLFCQVATLYAMSAEKGYSPEQVLKQCSPQQLLLFFEQYQATYFGIESAWNENFENEVASCSY